MFTHARIAATLSLVMITTAAAQVTLDLPLTIPWVDAAGIHNGTATHSGNRVYLRNHAGELVATIVVNPDGTITFKDASGKVIEQRHAPEAAQ